MRILLDSCDLINLVQNGRPPVAEFDSYLLEGNHQIVLCFSNVRELAGPLGRGAPFIEVRPLLQSLGQMPHMYLKEVAVYPSEIQSAVDAFTNGTEYQSCSLYVSRWDDTLASLRGQQGGAVENMVGLRLDDIVYFVQHTRPDIFAPPEQFLAPLQAQFENGRASHRAGGARDPQHFIDAFKRHAERSGVRVPAGREDEIAAWVYANPNRCPGMRLHHETYRALLENYEDIPKVGDLTDLALIRAVPYVDAATLDRRMRTYCAIASRRMRDAGAVNNYSERVYANAATLMEGQPNV
jgi:hypothetical protein